MTLRSLFVDFDSYFAAVEQQDDPALRGRPVAVVPLMADSTCCIAASYEAKAHGVTTGTRVAEARRLCPDLTLVQARHGVYVERHRRLVRAVGTCIPVDSVLSVDEMACTLTGSWRQPDRARAVAREIKAAVHAVGPALTCSIGIAPNRFLAKTASKMDKPDGVTLLAADDLPDALHGLGLGDLTGIGPRMHERLEKQGIRDTRALCAARADELRAAWGSMEGERMFARLRGRHVPEPESERTSVGHSHVLPPERRAPEAALAVLHQLLQKAAWRLRRLDQAAGGLTLHLRYVNGRRWRQSLRLEPSQDTLAFGHVLRRAWQDRPVHAPGLLAVGVTLTHLADARGTTRTLFDDSAARERLNAAVDGLNTRFGRNTVYFGGAHRARASAPMRIAFSRIPDPETEV